MLSVSAIRPRESPDEVAMIALEFGRLLLESGGSAAQVEKIAEQVALGLGAEQAQMRVGYASVSITVVAQEEGITRMRKVGALGVNERLHSQLQELAARIGSGGYTAEEASEEIGRVIAKSERYVAWVEAVAAGIACAAFGRLLDVDGASVPAIIVASATAQLARRQLSRRRLNVFLSTAVVAFLASILAGLGARLLGSQTVARDMIVSVLLLVPGVPAFNAQHDILEGRPTLGSARAVWVAVILMFMTMGVWLAQGMLGEGR